MRSGLLLILLIGLLAPSAEAASFACRDSAGKLYFTDNLADVPDGCRQTLKQIYPLERWQPDESVDSVSPAPGQAAPDKKAENQAGKPEVSDEQAARMQQRAEASARKYAQGAKALEEANSRRRFGSNARFAETRRVADEAKKLINEARQSKAELVRELESQQLPAQWRDDIDRLLNSIH